jgi:hypothetical protein
LLPFSLGGSVSAVSTVAHGEAGAATGSLICSVL